MDAEFVENLMSRLEELEDRLKRVEAELAQKADKKYKMRNLPCRYCGEELDCAVEGVMLDENGEELGAGVLEWAYDMKDATELFEKMSRFPKQFARLRVTSGHAKK